MQLEIQNEKLRKIINDSDKLIKRVGYERARKISQRFDQLQAFPNFKDYLNSGLGKPHPLTGNLNNLFGISLNENYRLVVEPLVLKLDDNSLKECKKINIKGVIDYHDGKNKWLIP